MPKQFAYSSVSSTNASPWRTSVWRRAPWDGLGALLLGLCCSLGAVVLVAVSDGKMLDFWDVSGYHVEPSVILSILSTAIRALLAYAFTCGVTISFWKHALQRASLKELHAVQQQGNGFFSIFSPGAGLNRVTVASFFVILTLATGPLFQRSIRVVPTTQQLSQDISVPISSSPLIYGSTGINSGQEPKLYHPLFARVVQQYNNRENVSIQGFNCQGDCETQIVGAGFDIGCRSWTSPYEIAFLNHSANYTVFSTNVTYLKPLQHPILMDPYVIELSTMFKATTGANGTLQWRTCTLREAMVRYPLRIDSRNTVTLRPMNSSENRTTQLVYRSQEGKYSLGAADTPQSTLGGLYLAIKSQYSATVILTQGYYSPTRWQLITSELVSSMYISSPGAYDLLSYNVTWSDPMDDMISTMQELSFRTLVATSSQAPYSHVPQWVSDEVSLTDPQPYIWRPDLSKVNRTTSQDIHMTTARQITVYGTEIAWAAVAFVIIVLAIVAISFTFTGWWQFGRPFSMSPLELAKAFDSPLMRQASSNSSISELLQAVGEKSVQYGATHYRKDDDVSEDEAQPPDPQISINDHLGSANAETVSSAQGSDIESDDRTDTAMLINQGVEPALSLVAKRERHSAGSHRLRQTADREVMTPQNGQVCV